MANNESRNANVHQDRERTVKKMHSQFDNLGLTKRNAEYMFKFTQVFANVKMDKDQKQTVVDQMVADLIAGQKSGKTAKNMWGTVDEKINSIVNPPKKAVSTTDYWPNALYNMILFLMIFTIVYGITGMFTKTTVNTTMGITGVVLTAVIAGLGIPVLSMLIAPNVKHKYSLWLRILMVVGFFFIWMLVFFVVGLIPRGLNPIPNPWVYITIGVLAGLAAFWYKHKFNITGGLF